MINKSTNLFTIINNKQFKIRLIDINTMILSKLISYSEFFLTPFLSYFVFSIVKHLKSFRSEFMTLKNFLLLLFIILPKHLHISFTLKKSVSEFLSLIVILGLFVIQSFSTFTNFSHSRRNSLSIMRHSSSPLMLWQLLHLSLIFIFFLILQEFLQKIDFD